MQFEGQTALVTGASSGIGKACALHLARQGADVAINYLGYQESARETQSIIEKLGRKAKLYEVDVSIQEDVEIMTESITAEFGSIDLLVTCAAFSEREPFYSAAMDDFRKTIDVTMWGAFYCLRAVTNQMIKKGNGGRVVIVSSLHALSARANCMAYNMAKAAIDQMARTAAIELNDHKIRVNIIHPGWTDTEGERKYFTEQQLAEAAKTKPMGRLARPEEIARGITFLLSPESEYINGSTLTIDGGGSLPFKDQRFVAK